MDKSYYDKWSGKTDTKTDTKTDADSKTDTGNTKTEE